MITLIWHTFLLALNKREVGCFCNESFPRKKMKNYIHMTNVDSKNSAITGKKSTSPRLSFIQYKENKLYARFCSYTNPFKRCPC